MPCFYKTNALNGSGLEPNYLEEKVVLSKVNFLEVRKKKRPSFRDSLLHDSLKSELSDGYALEFGYRQSF
jgi:hypothetical protein